MSMQSDDILIAVMGATGAGKSTFVRLATGDNSIRVGQSLRSGQWGLSRFFFHK